MKKILTSDKVYINNSKIHNANRGVYASRDIKKNELIERSPIIEISKHDMANLNESILVTYFFYFGKNKQHLAIALGFGSIYNHSYIPNAKYKIKPIDKTIEFIAIKDISKNDEITFNYKNRKFNNKKPLWFE